MRGDMRSDKDGQSREFRIQNHILSDGLERSADGVSYHL